MHKKLYLSMIITAFGTVALSSCTNAPIGLPSKTTGTGHPVKTSGTDTPTTKTEEFIPVTSSSDGVEPVTRTEINICLPEINGMTDTVMNNLDYFFMEHPQYSMPYYSITIASTTLRTATEVRDFDIFFTNSENLTSFVKAGYVSPLPSSKTSEVSLNNSSVSIAAGQIEGIQYAYPVSLDSGTVLYYDNRIIPAKDTDSLEKILEDCAAKGLYFNYECETSAWYNAGWFFGAGVEEEWFMGSSGDITSWKCGFNSDQGVIALRGMQHLLHSSAYKSRSTVSKLGSTVGAAVAPSSAYDNAKEALGDNLGIADLPSYTVDGVSYHLGSFEMNTVVGVANISDSKKLEFCHDFADFLTSEYMQERYYTYEGILPTNKKVMLLYSIQSNELYNAMSVQSFYAKPTKAVHNSWWNAATSYVKQVKEAEQDDIIILKNALNGYESTMENLLKSSPENRRAFTVIGTIKGTYWDCDYEMRETYVNSNIWISDTFYLEAGQMFKCRQGKQWDVVYGGPDGSNYIVETSGTYQIKLDANTGEITLIPQPE